MDAEDGVVLRDEARVGWGIYVGNNEELLLPEAGIIKAARYFGRKMSKK